MKILASSLLVGIGICSPVAFSQNANENPVYIADSPRARDSIGRIDQLLRQGNAAEATRLADELITTLGDQFVRSAQDDDIYITVRQRVHEILFDQPKLAEQYRAVVGPRAKRFLDEDKWIEVWKNAWFTRPGLIASIRLAQTQLENALFDDARRTLSDALTHPDADNPDERSIAVSGFAIAIKLTRYLDDPRASELASAWAKLASDGRQPLPRIAAPKDAHPVQHNALPTTAPVSNDHARLGSILPKPLQQAELTPIIEIATDRSRNTIPRSGASAQPTPWTIPAAAGGYLYTNDGFTISCFDRFTLRLVWRNDSANLLDDGPQSSSTNRARIGRLLADSCNVTIDRGTLFSALGLARGGNQSNEGSVVALDAESGALQWSIDLNELDPSLEDTHARGAIVVDGDTVIVAARKNSRQQRLVGMNLIGLNRESGALKWIRPIGSAGSLPFQQSGQIAHSGIAHRGAVYWSDAIGVVTAIEAENGRVLWVRQLPSPELYSRKTRPIWSASTPVIIQDRLFVLSPTSDELFEIDPESGEQLARRMPQPIGQVMYIVACGDTIACIGETEIAFYPVDDFASANPRRSIALGVGQGGISGRVVALGATLAVPLIDQVMLLDASDAQPIRSIELASTGNILPLDGQIVVVDESSIRSHLSWEITSQILNERINEGSDPSPAITLAELARSASHPDQILPAVDTAIRLAKAQTAVDQRATRKRLFAVVHDMIAPKDPADRSIIDADLHNALLDRMGTLASSNEQLVAHRFALGSQREIHARFDEAIQAYQDILAQRSLQTTMWEGEGFRVRAELEASKRVRAILARVGDAPYQIFDQLAAHELDALAGTPEAAPYEQLARKYPWTIAAARAWEHAAERWSNSEDHQNAVRAAQKGLRISDARDFDAPIPEAAPSDRVMTTQRLAGYTVSGLVAMNRVREARSFLADFQESYPELIAQSDGFAISLESLSSEAGVEIAEPTLGNKFERDASPMLIAGSPVIAGHSADPDSLVVYAPQYSQTQLLTIEGNRLVKKWSRTVDSPSPPVVLWHDKSTTLVLWSPINLAQPAILESIETSSGRSIWIESDLRDALSKGSDRKPDTIAQIDQQIPTPIGGPLPINQLVVTTDGSTVVVADRIGRAIGLDMLTGRSLWEGALPVNRVYDLDLMGSTLAVCGSMIVDSNDKIDNASTTQIVAAIDARTGDPVRIMDQLGVSMPRWIRVTGDNAIIAATGAHILSFDLEAAGLNWAFTSEDQSGHGGAGWIAGKQLIVLDDIYNKVYSIDRETGVLINDTIEWVTDRGWVDVRMHDNRVLVSNPGGLSVFSADGQMLASDPLQAGRQFASVAFAKDRAVFLRRPELDSQNRVSSSVVMLDTHNARILDLIELTVPSEIDRQPTSIQTLNNSVVVGYGEVSIVLNAPADIR